MFLSNDSNLQCTLSCKFHNFGLFLTVFGPFFAFFFFKAKITCVYSREHILTITKHLQPLCAIIVTYSVHFHVNFIVLGRFWQFFGDYFFRCTFQAFYGPSSIYTCIPHLYTKFYDGVMIFFFDAELILAHLVRLPAISCNRPIVNKIPIEVWYTI